MQKIFDAIIKTDLKAQQLAAEAEERQKNLQKEIEEKKQALRQMYMERAEARLNKIRAQEEEFGRQQTEQFQNRAKENKARLDSLYQANQKKWIEEITARIITP